MCGRGGRGGVGGRWRAAGGAAGGGVGATMVAKDERSAQKRVAAEADEKAGGAAEQAAMKKQKLAEEAAAAAAKAKADVVKFQVVYADDLSEPGYEYYELYKTLELAPSLWQTLRDQASKLGIDFVVDLFGPQSWCF